MPRFPKSLQNPNPLPVQATTKVALDPIKKKHSMTAHIEENLYEAVLREAKVQRRSVREIVEWGMKEFLFNANPRAAAKLGIHAVAE